jgi:hypothetical protein
MRPPQVSYGWNPIESAPFNEEVALQVTHGRGGPYTLQWPRRRTATGWINSRKGTPLEVTSVRWRPYLDRPPRPPRPERHPVASRLPGKPTRCRAATSSGELGTENFIPAAFTAYTAPGIFCRHPSSQH